MSEQVFRWAVVIGLFSIIIGIHTMEKQLKDLNFKLNIWMSNKGVR